MTNYLSLVRKLNKFTNYSENQNPTYYSKLNASIFCQPLVIADCGLFLWLKSIIARSSVGMLVVGSR